MYWIGINSSIKKNERIKKARFFIRYRDTESTLKTTFLSFKNRALFLLRNFKTLEDLIFYNSLQKVRSYIETLDNKKRFILIKRIVYRKTLQEIGLELGLTRERIRQLESRLLKDLEKNINIYIDYFLDKLKNQFFIKIKKFPFLYEDKIFFEILKKKSINFIPLQENYILTKYSIKSLENRILDLIFENGLPISINTLYEQTSKKYQIPSDLVLVILERLKSIIEENQLLNIKKLRNFQIIELILKKENKPLHISQVKEIYERLTKKKINVHNIDSLLQRNKNIILIDKGTFALKEYVYKELGDEYIRYLKNLSYEILKNIGGISDTSFLLEQLEKKIEIKPLLNPYLLKSLLKEDERFEYGRKFEIWLKEFNINERIDYEEIILNILNSSDKPISTEKIKEYLEEKGRSIPYVTINMVFNRSEKIIRVNENLYTSIDRINIEKEEIELFNKISQKLTIENNFPLSTDYIVDKIKNLNPKYNFLNRHILYSLLKNKENFQFISERLISLKNTHTPFKTYEDIFKFILEKIGKPTKIKELIDIYKEKTKDYGINEHSLYNTFYTRKSFKSVSGYIFLKEWDEKDFEEFLFETNKENIRKNIEDYLFYKQYSLDSFDKKEEKDKIKKYNILKEKFEIKEPTETEKVNWLKFLLEENQPMEILKLIKYINLENLDEDDRKIVKEIMEMFD